MTKHRLSVFFCSLCFFLFVPPGPGSAQTSSAPAREVAILAFTGEDAEMSALLYEAVTKEVEGLGGYYSRSVSGEEHPEILSSPPDEAPAPDYVGTAEFAFTGRFHIDLDEDLGYFQLWLWNSGDGSLVHTDEMVARDIDEALGYITTMVTWIFSHIPGEPGEGGSLAADRPGPRSGNDPLDHWLYLGLRGGGSFRFYTLPEVAMNNYSRVPHDFAFEGSFQIAFKFLPYMSVQAEAVFSHDRVKFGGPETHQTAGGETLHIFYTDSYSSMSLLFPLTVKFPLALDPYIISPFGGAYYTLPLGKMKLNSNIAARKTGDFDYDLAGGFGLIAGVDLGIRLGPGVLFLDTRYGVDLGETRVHMDDGNEVRYNRGMLSFSIGYELALLEKK
jgi:hypothetical protein